MEAGDWSNMIKQTQQQMHAMKSGAVVVDNKQVRMVELKEIVRDEEQPRKEIDPESEEMKELSQSIKQHGIINPISVRQDGNLYKIVAGERRYLAAKAAGLEKVPVLVLSEKDKREWCLIQLAENIQRKDLTPLEEARTYEKLKQEFNMKGVELAEMVKKDKSYISKMLRIAKIIESIQEDIAKNKISVSKEVLVLLSGFTPEEQNLIWQQIRNNPIESALKEVQTKIQTKEKKKPKAKIRSNPQEIFGALNRIIEKRGIESILQYISPGKVKKLLKDIQDEEKGK